MNTSEYVRKYVDIGFSVIRLRANDKRPALDWAEFQTRRPTEQELLSWFGNGSEYNIGIVTGRISGIAVVDLDGKEAIRFAKENDFPKTPLVKTGKGCHCYYRYKEGVRNFQKRHDLPGIDLRGDGGYVVAPPSIHPSGPHGVCQDGLGFIDLIALDPERGIVAVQCTTTAFKSRVEKILVECTDQAMEWLRCGGRIEVYGWRKVKLHRGGKALRWMPRIKEITLEDFGEKERE